MPGPTDRCPLCDGPGQVRLRATDRNRELGDERFRYRRCERCGTYWLVDVPADLGRFYIEAEEYYGLPSATELERLRAAEAHKLAFVRSHTAPGRLIEIGPGSGAFAYAARREGFEVTAVERDAQTCAHLQDVVGARAIQSEDPVAVLAGLPPARAIAMWHVLEHLPDPGRAIDAAASALEPGGVLALSTPNPRSLQFRLLRARWAHVDAPRHLSLVPLEALTRRAEAVGLRRVEATATDETGINCNLLGWEYGLRRRPARGSASRPMLLATFALERALRPVERRDLRGAAYTASFIKIFE